MVGDQSMRQCTVEVRMTFVVKEDGKYPESLFLFRINGGRVVGVTNGGTTFWDSTVEEKRNRLSTLEVTSLPVRTIVGRF